jgi:hypothetical protein
MIIEVILYSILLLIYYLKNFYYRVIVVLGYIVTFTKVLTVYLG